MNNREKQTGLSKNATLIIALVLLAVVLFMSLIGFITDVLWFDEMGYLAVFLKKFVTELTIAVPAFVVVTALVQLYLTRMRKSYFAQITSTEETDMKKLKKTTWFLAGAAGILAAAAAAMELWFESLKFVNSTDFGILDPLFNLDISFYIFKLEFLSKLNEYLIAVIIGLVAITVIYYMILMAVRTPEVFVEKEAPAPEEDEAFHQGDEERYTAGSNPFQNAQKTAEEAKEAFGKARERFTGHKYVKKEAKPKKQFDDANFKTLLHIASGKLTALGVIFFLMVAVNFFLRQFDLLHTHTGAVYGAGFTDVNITLWLYRVLCVLALAACVATVIAMKKKTYKKLLTVPVIMIVVGLIGYGGAYLIQNFVVSPDEINKEYTYLERNIEYTQYAYGLDNVDVKSFAADNKLTAENIAANIETINNIRVNDFDPAQQFYNQTQSIRQYYTFNDVDNDRYVINGKYTQTFLTAREIDENKISDTWLNKHIKYTHGYGVALSRVDKVTSSGQPDVLIGNIPPVSDVDEIQITRPEIYFGELSNEYIIVATDEQEFDYPDGDSNKYTKYEGNAGIKLNFLNRIIFSIKEGSLKLLVSSNVDSNSRIIINRNVVDRVKTIMPYLSYEGDPYMVTVDGELYWMMDAYTVSSLYPYSEPYNESGTNYIRNSVKVVIDAYDGDVSFYIVDEQDPIALTFQRIYPDLFKTSDQMPEGLRAHIRYPNTMFGIQANVYGRYHMEDVNVFYQNEDQWDVASEIYGMEKAIMTPNYYIAKLPGEKEAEFFNSIPFTPKSKQNMTALMVARNDGENYGQLVLYQFPKSRTIYGPEQVEAQIDQNTEISKEFSLWNSSGTQYRRGNLFVIPIETSVLYVEPVYLEAQNSSIPEVKRIIMVYKDQIAYEETLSECLIDLFGTSSISGVTGEDELDIDVDPDEGQDDGNTGNDKGDIGSMTQDELIQAAAKAFDKAQKAQQNGDWAKYGQYLADLEEYLNELAG